MQHKRGGPNESSCYLEGATTCVGPAERHKKLWRQLSLHNNNTSLKAWNTMYLLFPESAFSKHTFMSQIALIYKRDFLATTDCNKKQLNVYQVLIISMKKEPILVWMNLQKAVTFDPYHSAVPALRKTLVLLYFFCGEREL